MSSESPAPSPKAVGEAPPVPPEVLRLARRRLVSGERLEMSSLAAELRVNRVTLYRWVGSRERLLVEVLWSMADEAMGSLRSQVPPTDDRAVSVVVGFIECVLANPGMQHLLAVDTELMMRLLTHRAAAARCGARAVYRSPC